MTLTSALLLAVALLGTINGLVFVVGYNHKTHGTWRYYPMGIHLMGLGVALTATFAVIALSFLLDIHAAVWIALLASVVALMLQRNWMLFTTRWRSTGSEPSEDTERHYRKGQQ